MVSSSKEERKKQVGLYLEDELFNIFEDIRWRERLSRSELAHRAVEEYVVNHEQGNSTFKLDQFVKDPTFQAVPAISAGDEAWMNYYKDSNEKDRTRLRIQALRLEKVFRMIDFNEQRK